MLKWSVLGVPDGCRWLSGCCCRCRPAGDAAGCGTVDTSPLFNNGTFSPQRKISFAAQLKKDPTSSSVSALVMASDCGEEDGSAEGASWRLIGPVAALSSRRCRLIHSSLGRGSDVCLFYVKGEFFAMDARCAHSGKSSHLHQWKRQELADLYWKCYFFFFVTNQTGSVKQIFPQCYIIPRLRLKDHVMNGFLSPQVVRCVRGTSRRWRGSCRSFAPGMTITLISGLGNRGPPCRLVMKQGATVAPSPQHAC